MHDWQVASALVMQADVIIWPGWHTVQAAQDPGATSEHPAVYSPLAGEQLAHDAHTAVAAPYAAHEV